jgi:hypothetical protein
MSPLSLRPLTPAKLLFDDANKSGVPAILFGGAAGVNLNGGMRTTKPDNLKTLILTDTILDNLWNALPDDEKATYKEFLGDIGVTLGVCFLYLTLNFI